MNLQTKINKNYGVENKYNVHLFVLLYEPNLTWKMHVLYKNKQKKVSKILTKKCMHVKETLLHRLYWKSICKVS